MSDREIEQQIRSKRLQIERLEAEIREAQGYIKGLRRRLEQGSERYARKVPEPVSVGNWR